jgi:Fe-S-cluster containining protein
MSESRVNPCRSCTINQGCCTRLSGLMLTQDEYDRHFKSYGDGLVLRKSHGVFIVTPSPEGACPHWGNGGCSIYQDRPIDCRLHPFIIRHMIEKRREVKIVFHNRTECPQKASLCAMMPESEIRALVAAFGKKVYGENIAIIVHREKGPFSRLRHRLEAALRRRLKKSDIIV